MSVLLMTGTFLGTDRLAEAAQIIGLHDDDLVMNLQGDEPMMPASLISQVAKP